jgi:hypothetical protein
MIPFLLSKVAELGHAVFTAGDYNLNIIGIRSPTRVANAFNDELCVIYKTGGVWTSDSFEVTTDPGTPYLLKPINVAGAAVIAPGQYRGAYRIAKHRGQYDALCQVGGPVDVYRDDNRDNNLDLDPTTIQRGMFGISIHKRAGNGDAVNGASAGCTVFRHDSEFFVFMDLCRAQVNERGFSTFTYTVVNYEDL